MGEILASEYVWTIVYYSVTIASLVVFLFIFELVTKYNNWEQIRKGNVAVAMATSGKIFGIANVFRFSIEHHDTLAQTLIWGVFGFVLLLAAYFIFEFLTPKFNVDQEIGNDNRAVGLLSMIISIALSYIVGASISSKM